jgi:hypothetical protein
LSLFPFTRFFYLFPGIRLDCIHLPCFRYPFVFFPLRLFPYAVAKEHSKEDSLETGTMEVRLRVFSRELRPAGLSATGASFMDELIIDLKSSARRLSAFPNSP